MWLQRSRWDMRTRSGPFKLNNDRRGACYAGDRHARAPKCPRSFNLVGAISICFTTLLAVHSKTA